MHTVLYLIGGSTVLVCSFAHLYVRLRLRPRDESLDEYYYEFEDRHPGYARYLRWSRITFGGIAAGTILLLAGLVI